MEIDIRNANAAMAGELGPLARQKSEPILHQGRSLSHRLGASDAWTVSIEHKTNEIERKLTSIESLAASRGREVIFLFCFEYGRIRYTGKGEYCSFLQLFAKIGRIR